MPEPSRIAIAERHFWPETVLVLETALADDIAALPAEASHQVEVIASWPIYNPETGLARRSARETWNGVTIRRLPPLSRSGSN